MKRYRLATRILTLIVATWFVTTAGIDASGVHRCPHHDVVPGETAAPDAAHAHAGHHAAATDRSAADSHDSHGPCTCVGQCSLANGASLPATQTRAAPALEAVTATRIARRSATQLRSALRYLRPFATAPPSVFSA